MKNIKLKFAYSIVLFVNLLFSIKYLSRFSDLGVYLAFVLLVVQLLIIIYCERKCVSIKAVKYFSYFFILILITSAIVSHYFIKLEHINVDRWSVINSFLTELFNGNYPYLAKSHLGNYPGPMPVYFAIALPFYTIGELSLLSVLGYLIFIYLLLKKSGVNPKSEIIILLLFTSLFVYWEIVTRSNIFSYSVIIFLVLRTFLSIEKNNYNKKFFLSAVLTGLLLSTRSVFILAYIITFLSSFIRGEIKLKSLFIYTMVSSLAFLFTFLPFLLFYKNEFFLMNPFIIQSSILIPQVYVFVFIFISILLSFIVKNDLDKYFYIGISLFISIAIYFVYHSFGHGFEKVFLENGLADISYFIFCMPFLFYFILKSQRKGTPIIDNND